MKPPIKFDWTVNLTQVFTIVTFIITLTGAWHDVKSEIKVNQQEAKDFRLTVDDFMRRQGGIDTNQDAARERLATDVKQTLRDSNQEIKQEIRDLRTDLIRSKSPH